MLTISTFMVRIWPEQGYWFGGIAKILQTPVFYIL